MYLDSKQYALKGQRWLIILAAVFIISAATYGISNISKQRFLFFFPDAVSGEIVGEYRNLPRLRGRDKKISQLVDEVILGPGTVRSLGIFPRDTSIRAVYYIKPGLTVIDLSRNASNVPEEALLDVPEALDLLYKTVDTNFPGLREIRILIDGQEPFQPMYQKFTENQ